MSRSFDTRIDQSPPAGFDIALVDALLAPIAARLARRRTPLLVGLWGLQGSGKSTLAAQLVGAANARGIDALAVSIDDFYFARRERLRLARHVHPLLATRGVPGTHDLPLLHATLAALARATPVEPACVPRFDKGRDTRQPRSRWRVLTRPPRLIVLEGWCVGVPPQGEAALVRPINALEREDDRDGCWRRHVDRQLGGDYSRLWRQLHLLVALQAPSFAVVERWRGEQEQCLRRRHAPQAMDAAALTRFIAHYERLSRHALRMLPPRADWIVTLDAQRRVRALSAPAHPDPSRVRTARC